jgi:hypothetical protein
MREERRKGEWRVEGHEEKRDPSLRLPAAGKLEVTGWCWVKNEKAEAFKKNNTG